MRLPLLQVSSLSVLLVGSVLLIGIGCAESPSNVNNNPAVPQSPVATALPAAQNEPGPDAEKEFTTTESGLKYRILRKGEGSRPTAQNTVLAHYRGRLDDGTEFDSSYKRGEPTEFPLSGVIPGWTEGLQLIGEGGKIELEIPYSLGYGERGFPPDIPPQATLHFIVELIKVR